MLKCENTIKATFVLADGEWKDLNCTSWVADETLIIGVRCDLNLKVLNSNIS